MKGIIVLSAFVFLFVINTLSAQSNINFDNKGDVDIGLVDNNSTYPAESISLKRREQNGISVYPNPAKSRINLQFTATKTTSIRISNIIGSVLYEVGSTSDTGLHSQTFDISKLPKGLYFMTIDDGENKRTKRFVKQ